jgi:hypothetical protein
VIENTGAEIRKIKNFTASRPFRPRPFLYNLFSAAGRLSLPAAEKEKEIPPGKAEPFRKARGEAPRGLG